MRLSRVYSVALFAIGFLFTAAAACLLRAVLGAPWGIALIMGAMVGGVVVTRTWVTLR